MTPVLSVIALSWNQINLTQRCVESLRANTDVDFELIIVDNGSTDGSAELARELADLAIANDTNLGFAAGMNQGLAAATGRYIAFVNNDTEFPERWASNLIETLDQDGVGIALPAVTNAGMTFTVRESPGAAVSTIPPFSELPSGVVVMTDHELISDLGGWNEIYEIAAAEDFDLWFTAWSNGVGIALDERVLVHHVGSASADLLPERQHIWIDNRNRFLDRWSAPQGADIPRLETCGIAKFEENLDAARLAVAWIARYFDAHDTLSGERQRIRELKAAARVDRASLGSRIRRRLRS